MNNIIYPLRDTIPLCGRCSSPSLTQLEIIVSFVTDTILNNIHFDVSSFFFLISIKKRQVFRVKSFYWIELFFILDLLLFFFFFCITRKSVYAVQGLFLFLSFLLIFLYIYICYIKYKHILLARACVFKSITYYTYSDMTTMNLNPITNYELVHILWSISIFLFINLL